MLDNTVIRTDADLLELALGYFDEYESSSAFHGGKQEARRFSQHQQEQPNHGATVDFAPSPSSNWRAQQLRAVQDDPALYAQQHAEHSRRRADRWLQVLQYHNRDFTFTPAICQRSVNMVSGGGSNSNNNNNNNHNNVVERLYDADVARRRENESERELQNEANRILRQHQILHDQRVAQRRLVQHTYGDGAAAMMSPTKQRAAGRRASERLYRQASQIPYTTTTAASSSSRHMTPTATASRALTPRNTHHHNNAGSTTPLNSNQNHGGTGGDSPSAVEPPRQSVVVLSPGGKQRQGAAGNPRAFGRLYRDAQALQEKRAQRIADASYIKMKQLADWEYDEVLERVTTQALAERAENNERLQQQFGFNRKSFQPTIDEFSSRMVTARNAAAGDVFKRLIAKAPQDH
jgi:hypothetical protein